MRGRVDIQQPIPQLSAQEFTSIALLIHLS